jgi:hypothetical protein
MTLWATDRRRALGAVLAGWALVAVLALLRDWQTIASLHFSDPDDALRMVQVRDLLAGQGWFDLHQYRVAPPDGIVMHWSRLVDAPIAAVIMLLRPLLGAARAELAAVAIVPLLTLLAAQLCLARLVARQLDTRLVLIATLLMLLMLPAMLQFEPPRIDHHAWQVVAVVAALNALLAKTPRAAALIAGLSLAFGLAVSLELLPFAGLFGAVFALRWWRNPGDWRWLAWYLDVLVIGSAVFFVGTRGLGDLTNYCDTVSPAYLAALGSIALGVNALALRAALPRLWLVAGLGLVAAGGAALFLLIAPGCSAGPFARLDPLVRNFWYDNVKEGMPVWRQDWTVLMQMTLPPLVGLGVAINLARRDGGQFWREFALLLGGAVVISIAVSRFSSVSSAIAIVPLTWLVRRCAQGLSEPRPLAQRAMLALLMLVALLPGLLLDLAGRGYARAVTLAGAVPAGATVAQTHEVSVACGQPSSLSALARQPPGTIMGQFDLGPFVLLHTPHSVIATPHHRAAAAMHDTIAAFLAAPDQARGLAALRHVDYVMLCPDLVETHMYLDRAPNGLAAQLLAGRTVDWLEPVALGPQGGAMRLWRVRPAVKSQPALNSIASPSMQ